MNLILLFLLFTPQDRVMWPRDTAAQVYFLKGDFTQSQQDTCLRGLRSWDVAGTGIIFTVVGDTDTKQTCGHCITFLRASLVDEHEAGKLWAWMVTPQIVDYAWIAINDKAQGAEAIQSVSAHEFGHLLGVPHSDKGIMSPFKGFDKTNGNVGPTASELEAQQRMSLPSCTSSQCVKKLRSSEMLSRKGRRVESYEHCNLCNGIKSH